MPRRINYLTGHWSDLHRFGNGESQLEIDDYFLVPHLSKTCFTYTRIARDKDIERNGWDPADDIFNWVQNHVQGKWHLDEHYHMGPNRIMSQYFFENESDSRAFGEVWGHIFHYSAPPMQVDNALSRVESRLQEIYKPQRHQEPAQEHIPSMDIAS